MHVTLEFFFIYILLGEDELDNLLGKRKFQLYVLIISIVGRCFLYRMIIKSLIFLL